MRQKRRIRGDDNDDRSCFPAKNGILRDLLTDRNARDSQLRAAAAIGLHERTDNISAALLVEHPRGRPRASFEFETNHAGPSADTALGDWSRSGRVESIRHVFWFDVESIHIIKVAVPSLRDDRQTP